MELTITSIMWIGLSILMLSILFIAYLIDKSIEKRRNNRIWYLYDKENHAIMSGPYTKGKALSMLKLYSDKEHYLIKRSKNGYAGKDRRKFSVVRECQGTFNVRKFYTIQAAWKCRNENIKEGLVSYINANLSKMDIMKIIIVSTLDSYEDILKDYWDILKKTIRSTVKFIMGSILLFLYLFGSTLLGVTVAIISTFSKTMRNDITSSYIEEPGNQSNKGESKAAERHSRFDESIF